MKKTLQVILLITILSSLMCKNNDLGNQYPETIMMDQEYLASIKVAIKKGDPQFKNAYNHLLEDAEVALTEGPFSVTNKEKLAPSGDKHDYASYSRYWWPDSKKPDGLPFIRRDGETNPSSQNPQETDRQRIGKFTMSTESLALAYYLTEEKKYAIKAAELLRVWFLDKETRMNPNVNHAQIREGHNEGTKSGILDARLLIQALEGSLLITDSSAFSSDEEKRLQIWTSEYLDWLTTNTMALAERATKNNHGSYYDVQAMYLALYSKNHEAATQIADNFYKRRVLSQINLDGSMPEELARTRSLFYSIYNLHALFIGAHLANKVGVNVWETNDENSRLRAALDYIAPYADTKNIWPHKTIIEVDRMEIFPILQMANRIYPDGNYLKYAEKLPLERRTTHRVNLAFPLIR